MNKRSRINHVIDAIFPIAVLFVFAVSAMVVLLLAARIYSSTTSSSEEHFSDRTSYAYVSEKMRQGDVAGGVSVDTVEGRTCLALRRSYANGLTYVTYIYELDGNLMELRARDGVNAPLSTGTAITSVSSFNVEDLSDGRFSFTIVDEDGKELSWIAAERSTP